MLRAGDNLVFRRTHFSLSLSRLISGHGRELKTQTNDHAHNSLHRGALAPLRLSTGAGPRLRPRALGDGRRLQITGVSTRTEHFPVISHLRHPHTAGMRASHLLCFVLFLVCVACALTTGALSRRFRDVPGRPSLLANAQGLTKRANKNLVRQAVPVINVCPHRFGARTAQAHIQLPRTAVTLT